MGPAPTTTTTGNNADVPQDAGVTVKCEGDAGTLCADRDLDRCSQQCSCDVYKACEKLAEALRSGSGIAPDRTRSTELFDKACKGGLMKSCGAYADALRFGSSADKPRAAELYDKACTNDDVWSCVQLADMKGTGDGIPHDKPGATKLYQKACDKGDPLGCASAGRAYLHGEGVKANKEKGIALLRAAYKKGILWAADELKKIGVKP